MAGLQWRHIDNNKKTITVEDNLIYVNGHTYLNYEDLKTQASSRTLPVSDDLLKLLSNTAKDRWKTNCLYGSHYIDNIYNDEQQHFIMTWQNGKVLHPNYYIKNNEKNGIEKKIRFHDLRHTNFIRQKSTSRYKRLGHSL